SDMRAGRSVALGAAVGLVFVVIVEIAVLGLSGSTSITTDVAATLSIWFLFAVVSAVALTAPRSVQEELDEPLAGGPAPPGLSEYPAGGEEPRRHGRPGARSDGPDESGPPPPEETGAHMADESIWEASNDEPASTQPPQDEHSDPSVFTAQTAANPNTPPNVLAEIATHRPELRPLVAHNPSSYPGLLEWLDQLGDPAVDYVLRRRSSR
ncbi:hypothetical protein, partial [Phytoactinopolyspora endophytica]|uniref:variant leucine-rich repeat-containing protein n=1 Tax=Phytoactinopolyspora endophytica TaxID=1642495 RepID=UPI0030B84420